MADIVSVFASRVRNKRKERGLSQEGLADLAGLHRTYIGGLERGEINATLRSANRIAAALDATLAELLHGAENPPSHQKENRDR